MDGGAGGCLCGAVRYSFDGAPNWQAHCHCESCRRATSAPIASFFAVSHDRIRWSGIPPQLYESSPGIFRSFCPRCGSPLTYQSNIRTGEIDLYAATLDDPAGFAAERHLFWDEHLSWLCIADDLPKHRSPRQMDPAEDFGPVLALIRAAFAFMEGRIDPPSSMHRLTGAALSEAAGNGEVWVAEDDGAPVACVVLTPRANDLYLGKLAVAASHRRKGLARQMVDLALSRAKALGKPAVALQTRIELTENHAAFEAMGFARTGETAHEGYSRPTTVNFRREVG